MSKNKTALVLGMRADDSNRFNQVLNERGFNVRRISVPSEGVRDIDPLKDDLVLIMGGPIGVYQADDYPFLKDKRVLIKERTKADAPTLGICLGAQIIASALGSEVHPGKQGFELGWSPLTLTEAGENTAVQYIAGDKTPMFHWHGDTFDLPQGVTLLASSDKYPNQVYSYGKNILGIQCHPEMTQGMIEELMVSSHMRVSGESALTDIHTLREEIIRNSPILDKQARLFFNTWLDEVGL